MSTKQEDYKEFSFINYFVPLTTLKSIHYIVIVGFLVYGNMLINGFVWDDLTFIVNNHEIHAFNLSKIFGVSLYNSGSYYRPIQALYVSILYGLFNESSFIFHFVQLFLHIVSVLLVFILFKRSLGNTIALCLALLFLTHPINTEAVSYISAVNVQLFTIPGLLALLFIQHVQFFKTRHYILVASLLFISLLAKEEGILFFIICTIYSIINKHKNFKRLLIYNSLSFISYAILKVLIELYQGTNFQSFLLRNATTVDARFVPIMELTFLEKIVNVPSIILYYFKTFIFPFNLSVNQLWYVEALSVDELFWIIIIFGIFITFGFHIYRKSRSLFKEHLFFLMILLLGLFIHLPFIPLDMTVADRWFYIPMIGLLGVIGLVIKSFINNVRMNIIFTIIFIFTIIIFSSQTIIRNTQYRDEITLYKHDRQISTNYDIELNLGAAYAREQHIEDALFHLTESTKLHPYPKTYFNLALIYVYKGDYVRAENYFKKAMSTKTNTAQPDKHELSLYTEFALLYIHLDHYKEAKEIILKGINYYPESAMLWEALALCEYQLHNYNDALSSVHKAIQLGNRESANNLYQLMMNNEILPPDYSVPR